MNGIGLNLSKDYGNCTMSRFAATNPAVLYY